LLAWSEASSEGDADALPSAFWPRREFEHVVVAKHHGGHARLAAIEKKPGFLSLNATTI
jgi:hypothetical protein